MSMDFGFDVISEDEYQRQRALYGPLTESLRKLIDAALHTEVDERTVSDAKDRIEALTELLDSERRTVTTTLRHESYRPSAGVGQSGCRTAQCDRASDGHPPRGRRAVLERVHAQRRLRGTARLGARWHLRFGARPPPRRSGQRRTDRSRSSPAPSRCAYLRGTPLGPLRAEAAVEREEGVKTFAKGYLIDADGVTVEAEGVFIRPAWARDAG